MRTLTGLVAALALASSAAAQNPPGDPRPLEDRLRFFPVEQVRPAPAVERSSDLEDLSDVLQSPYALVFYAMPPKVLADDFRRFLQDAQRARVDQQVGSGTAATRTGLTSLLGFALESGAVSQAIDKQQATLRANADGLLRFLSNEEVIPTCAGDDDLGCSKPTFLKDLDVAATFIVGEADKATVEGTAVSGQAVAFSTPTGQKFTGVTARYALQNNRDVRSDAYRRRWADVVEQNSDAIGAAGQSLTSYVAALTGQIQTTDAAGNAVGAAQTEYTQWRRATVARLQMTNTTPELAAAFSAQLDDLIARMRRRDPAFDDKLSALSEAYLRYLALRRDLASTIVTDPALTVEYTYATPLLEPKLHTVKVAWAVSPGTRSRTPNLNPGQPGFRPSRGNPGTITVNASLDYFQEAQPVTAGGPATARWKSGQLALQFDRPLGPGDSAARLSLGAYYQYQFNPSLIAIPADATLLSGTSIPLTSAGRLVLSEKGSIAAAQAVLTLRLGSSGLIVPLGVSWANRTELTTGNEVRGHIGFTFDTTQLLLLSGLR